jgi:hypothetical protein
MATTNEFPYPSGSNGNVTNITGGTAGSGSIPKGSASSMIQFGAAFPAGVTPKQTILPIFTAAGVVVGFFPITSTTFTGTERTFALASGTVPITSVTLPEKNKLSFLDNQYRNEYFMAAVWPEGPGTVGPTLVYPANPSNPSQTITAREFQPWRGYLEFVDGAKPNSIGYYSWWSMPAVKWFNHFGLGTYLNALVNDLDFPIPAPPSTNPPTPVTPQTLRWACTANAESLLLDCAFFDFNWVSEFKLAFQQDTTQQGNGALPMSIAVTSNPAGGYFKASVVQGLGQSVIAGGGVVFDTIRILRLEDPPAGSYTFNFSISQSQNGTTSTVPVVLTLTVV